MTRRALRDTSGAVRRLAKAFQPSLTDVIAVALGRLLVTIEAGEIPDTTAAEALHRHGANLFKASGSEAMRAALDQVCAARPGRAAERRALISAVWGGLEGWQP